MTTVIIPWSSFVSELDDILKQNLTEKKMKNFKKTAAALLVMAVLMTGAANGQKPIPERAFSKVEITNLVNGLNSENTGLKKSAVYMAGKYKVNEAVETLTEMLFEEKDPAVRLLVARALYEIGNLEGMLAVYELSKTDKNVKVRAMSKALFEDYVPQTNAAYTLTK